jgi:glycosyltransferase involved in cell wall biosynthesis
MRRRIAHFLAAPLRRYARGQPRGPADHVTFLLLHAWGMGGTIRVTLDIAGRLAGQHEVEVLSIVRRRDEPFFGFPAGVTVTAVDDQRKGHAPLLGRVLSLLPSVLMPRGDAHAAGPCTLWTDVCLARALRRLPGGVVIGSRPGLTVLALEVAAPGLKVAGHEHMHLSAHPKRVRRMIASRYRGLDGLIVLTRADRDEFAKALDGTGVPIVCIPNATRDLGGPPSALENRLIIAAGRLANQKGFDMLIQAFAQVNARHPDWQLRICGAGPHARRLRRLAARMGLSSRVALPGRSASLGEEMARASMLVLSSRFEGFPLVLVEAMHKGLPVVSFDCPTGPGEIVEDRRNGILVPAEDVDGLARGMIALIEDPELRRRCGAEAARTAEAYRMDVIGPKWDAFVAELLAREPALSRRRSGSTPAQAAVTSSSSVGSS